MGMDNDTAACFYDNFALRECRVKVQFPLDAVYFAEHQKKELDAEGELVKTDRDRLFSRLYTNLDAIEQLKKAEIDAATDDITLIVGFTDAELELSSENLDHLYDKARDQIGDVVHCWNENQRGIEQEVLEWFKAQGLAPVGSVNVDDLAEDMF